MKRLLFAVAIGLACLGSSAWAASDDLVEEKMLLPDHVIETNLVGDTVVETPHLLYSDPVADTKMLMGDPTVNDPDLITSEPITSGS